MGAISARQSGSSTVWALVLLTTLLLFGASLYAIFMVAPVEKQMGIAQKIFYFHVPSAYAMYIGFGLSALGSLMYLIKRDAKWDAVGVAGAEVGFLFWLIVICTGPLWARKAWGVWWTWDPRLTTTLLAGMIFAAYLALRSMGEAGEVEKRFAAGLGDFRSDRFAPDSLQRAALARGPSYGDHGQGRWPRVGDVLGSRLELYRVYRPRSSTDLGSHRRREAARANITTPFRTHAPVEGTLMRTLVFAFAVTITLLLPPSVLAQGPGEANAAEDTSDDPAQERATQFVGCRRG